VTVKLQGDQKNWHTFLYALPAYVLASSNINGFSNLFHSLKQENICNNTVTNYTPSPQVCRYNTFWNVSVLKAIIETRRILHPTRFKKLTTGNNVFIVSVII